MLGEKSSGASPKCSYLAPNSSLLRWILNIFIDPAGPVQPVGEENVYQNNPRKNWLKFYDCVFVWLETCLGPPALAAIHLLPLLPPLPHPSTHKQKTQPTWSCKSNKSWDQYCKYNFYSPTNFSQELFVMKLVFCLQTKIGGQLGGWLGGLVTRQNLNEKMINLTTLCTFEWWEVRGLEKADLEI